MTGLALDLDGTLIDCRSRQMAVLRRILGSRLTGDLAGQIWRQKRKGRDTRQALQWVAPELRPRFSTERWMALIESEWALRFDHLLAGALPVVTRAVDRWGAVHLVTARRDGPALERQLARLGLGGITSVTVVDPVGSVADTKAAALRRHGVVAYIGDTELDGRAARRAQVRFLAVSTGQRNRAYLEDHGFAVADGLAEAESRLRIPVPVGSPGE